MFLSLLGTLDYCDAIFYNMWCACERTNSVEVVCKENIAKFTTTFHNDHLDVDWQLQDEQIIHSHGLMG